ncbi:MAG: hypothetical protein Q4F29_09525, partial [Lachnospiraceae bacterium]|nr:hypothetical protein [Lachnospiraceae bacterium]
MKNNLKIWMVILGIVVSGLLITSFTSLYVSKQREKLNIRPMTASFSASSAAQDAGAGRTALSDKADTAARPGVQSSRTAAPGEAAAGGEAGTGGAEAARTADEGPAGLAPASAMPEMALAETEAEA